MRPALCLSSVFDGFAWVEGTREWGVEGTLEAKLERWHEEDGLERRRWADDSMESESNEQKVRPGHQVASAVIVHSTPWEGRTPER